MHHACTSHTARHRAEPPLMLSSCMQDVAAPAHAPKKPKPKEIPIPDIKYVRQLACQLDPSYVIAWS